MKAFAQIGELNQSFEKIKEQNNQLLKKIDQIHTEAPETRTCRHCSRKFVTLMNDEKGCTYHSGKLKFFSCKYRPFSLE
jgi:hypothetical protein